MLEENWKNSEFYHCYQSWIIFLDCESYYICLLSQDKQKNFHIPWAQRTLHQWVFDVFSMKLENQLTARLYHINQVYLKWGISSHFSRKEKYIAFLHTPILTRPLSIVTSGIPSTFSITFSVFFNMLFPSVAYSSEVPEGFQPHIFAEILLGRIHQSPLFPREVYTNIIIGHCIHSAAATLARTPQTAEPTVQHMDQLLSCLLSYLTQFNIGTGLWLEIDT